MDVVGLPTITARVTDAASTMGCAGSEVEDGQVEESPLLREAKRLAAEHERDGVVVELGTDWDGRLDEWLARMAAHDPDSNEAATFQAWSFPTDGLLRQYVGQVDERPEQEVRHLLRCLLWRPATFGTDRDILWWATRDDGDGLQSLLESEYGRRLLHRDSPAQPGVRWVLDALPSRPHLALATIRAYVVANGHALPDFRLAGLSDAQALISARYMRAPGRDATVALQSISPREFEHLVANLYVDLGYEVTVTPASRDGGRDVIAIRDEAGRRERRLIECKLYAGTVHVVAARALLGVVSTENATNGVLVTSGHFTKGSRLLAQRDPRLDLVDGAKLAESLAQRFGSQWPREIDSLVRWPRYARV